MKRMLAVAIAAVFTVAFAVSAMADVKVSGEYRLRMESRDNADLEKVAAGGDKDNVAFYGQRVRLSVDATPTDDVAVKVTLQDTTIWGKTTDNLGNSMTASSKQAERIALHEGYLLVKNFFGTPVAVKVGRQEINLGDQRQIGSSNWSNNGRAFDAIAAVYGTDAFTLTLADIKVFESNDAAGAVADDTDAYVVYATVKTIPNNVLDLYYISVQDGNGHLAVGLGYTPTIPTQTNIELNTMGLRLAGAASGLDYTLEYATQSGDVEDATGTVGKFKGNALAAKLGYTLPGENNIRIGVEYDQASGDKAGGTNKIKRYIQLFPSNHDKYGYMDLVGWSNIKALNVNVGGNINEKLSARLDYWTFARESKDDFWIKADGSEATVCGPCTPSSDKIGSEIDLTFGYKYNAALGFQLGYSQFSPGKFVKESVASGKTESQTWTYLMATAKF